MKNNERYRKIDEYKKDKSSSVRNIFQMKKLFGNKFYDFFLSSFWKLISWRGPLESQISDVQTSDILFQSSDINMEYIKHFVEYVDKG